MATASLSLVFLKPSALSQDQSWFQARPRTKTISTIIKAQSGSLKEDVIIVGAGIAGLATAVSLHRFD